MPIANTGGEVAAARPRRAGRRSGRQGDRPAAVDSMQARARRAAPWVLVVALAYVAASGWAAARTYTPTADEFVYLPAGYYHLRTGDLSFDPTNPPLLKIAMAAPLLAMDLDLDPAPQWRDNSTGWAPWIFGTRFMEINRDRYLDAFFVARLVVLLVTLVLGVLLFFRARGILSPLGALVTIVLFATQPPILAHGSLATLDIGVTMLGFAAFLALVRFTPEGSLRWAAATGSLLGLAFVAKGITAVFLPVVGALVLLDWRSWDAAGIRRLLSGAAVMAASAWMSILAAYGFSGFPLPGPLVEGIRFQIAASSAGEFPAFLHGEWSQRGWWYYYLVALALKTPLPTLVLLGVGSAVVVRGRLRNAADRWIVLPPLVLLYALSFHYGKNYGIRYLLPAYPFLLLLAGRGADALLRWRGKTGGLCVGALLAWQIAATTANAPHHLAYFNEFVGGPDRGRRWLLDSNLDWGQDLGRLKDYLDARGTGTICLGYFGHVDPHLYGIDYSFPPTTPTAGTCAVSANFLAGYPYAVTYAGPRIRSVRGGAWSWFDRLEPVARIGRSIYVFDVTEEDVRNLSRGRAPVDPGT